MTKQEMRTILSGMSAIALLLGTIRAEGNPEERAKIKLQDADLLQYINTGKATIYTGLASNLILQQIFAEELRNPEVKADFDRRVKEFLEAAPSVFAESEAIEN